MSTPALPPRPARSQNPPSGTNKPDALPIIPPRPKRNVDRSISPHRDSFARSPLNDPSFIPKGKSNGRENTAYKHGNQSDSSLQRQPSLNLPSIGQEGAEYASLDSYSRQDAPEQTKIVAGDLPLHAPKASLPPSSAKSRIATVTRTDSSQAAAVGIGKPFTEHEIKIIRTGSSNGTNTPSLNKEELEEQEVGIPEIGMQIPLYKNAGDVQAPTPSPSVHGQFFGTPSLDAVAAPRHHVRTKSGREIFKGPPGSYGLHGHGKISNDPLEKAWYSKHPDARVREQRGEYGPAISETRKEYMLSSEELNKLVHESGNHGIGMGTSALAVGTPDEQIGYIASEEYASRMTSPRPASIQAGKPRSSSGQAHMESPLRKMSFPAEELENKLEKTTSRAVDSEAEDEVIHIDNPVRRQSKVFGPGFETPEEAGDGHAQEDEEEAPILAADEVAKRPEVEHLQPAVTPDPEHRSNNYYENEQPLHFPGGRRGSRPSSRPTSRPSSIHGASGLSRLLSDETNSSTPLDNVKEYEPLFPEDEEEQKKLGGKPKTSADKLKRPDYLARHHFPSQDIWEDTPDSLRLQTTVETPQIEMDAEGRAKEPKPAPAFETPEQEAARKSTLSAKDQESFLSEHTKKLAKKPFSRDVMRDVAASRPGMGQRFPSQDIWEDSPDSTYITTTVETPESQDKAPVSPDEAQKPAIPARPAKGDVESSKPPPAIPSRPPRRSTAGSEESPEAETSPERKMPALPGRPKPQIPVRPNRAAAQSTATTTSTDRDAPVSTEENVAPKAKPAVPSRPLGNKIAALKAGFMSDLNSRLQLGPQAPKKEEAKEEVVEEKEKAPLADARKGRARGPQRRKPGVSPSGAAALAEVGAASKWSIVGASTVWSIDDEGALSVPEKMAALKLERQVTNASEDLAEAAKEEDEEPELPPSKPVVEEDEESVPAPVAAKVALPAEEPTSSSSTAAVQTGEHHIQVNDPKGASEKMDVFLGGRAPEEGTVIVKDGGEEVVLDGDERGAALKTGGGM